MVMGPYNCRLHFSFYLIPYFSSKHADLSSVQHGIVDCTFLSIRQVPSKSYIQNSDAGSMSKPSLSQKVWEGGKCISLPWYLQGPLDVLLYPGFQ